MRNSLIWNKGEDFRRYKIKFHTDVHNLNLRFRGLITPSQHHTTVYERSFTYNVYKLYNGLSISLKKKLKKVLYCDSIN